jgi:glucokinase
MSKEKVIGIDLGATNVRGACVSENEMSEIKGQRIRSNGTKEEVLEDVFTLTDKLMNDEIAAIGMGVRAWSTWKMELYLTCSTFLRGRKFILKS